MSKNWYFKSGSWNAICDSCGRKFKAHQLKKRWDGLMVCSDDWETRHPQEFLRARPDRITPPWTRPQLTEVFLPVTVNILDTIYLSEQCIALNNKSDTETDTLTLSEVISTVFQYYRLIPGSGTQTDGVINGGPVDALAINGSSTTYGNTTETLTLSESVVTSQGFGRNITDSISVTESVTTFKYISNPINQLAVNALFIG